MSRQLLTWNTQLTKANKETHTKKTNSWQLSRQWLTQQYCRTVDVMDFETNISKALPLNEIIVVGLNNTTVPSQLSPNNFKMA